MKQTNAAINAHSLHFVFTLYFFEGAALIRNKLCDDDPQLKRQKHSQQITCALSVLLKFPASLYSSGFNLFMYFPFVMNASPLDDSQSG